MTYAMSIRIRIKRHSERCTIILNKKHNLNCVIFSHSISSEINISPIFLDIEIHSIKVTKFLKNLNVKAFESF